MPLEVVVRAHGDNLRGQLPGITFLVGNQEGGQNQEGVSREIIAQGTPWNGCAYWCTGKEGRPGVDSTQVQAEALLRMRHGRPARISISWKRRRGGRCNSLGDSP